MRQRGANQRREQHDLCPRIPPGRSRGAAQSSTGAGARSGTFREGSSDGLLWVSSRNSSKSFRPNTLHPGFCRSSPLRGKDALRPFAHDPRVTFESTPSRCRAGTGSRSTSHRNSSPTSAISWRFMCAILSKSCDRVTYQGTWEHSWLISACAGINRASSGDEPANET